MCDLLRLEVSFSVAEIDDIVLRVAGM